MSEFENTGSFMAQESAADAAQLAPETGAETGEAFSDFTGDAEPETETQVQAEAPAKEPGWIKGRIDKAVQKAIRETEQRMQAQFDARFAPLRERMMDEQAQDLVKAGEFKSIERAKEYVRLKGGVTLEEPANAQEAQPAQRDPAVDARLQMLAKQADKLKARGQDVMAVFQSDEGIRNAILSGDMDFYDVAEQMQPRRRMPSAVRSANNAGGQGSLDILGMSDAQFQKLQRDLAAGKKYDLRR